MSDIDKALLDPTSVFHTPDEVLQRDDLSRAQKIKILRRWEYDARELEVAEDENMGGPQPDILDQIITALRQLGASFDEEHAPPTKQGGETED